MRFISEPTTPTGAPRLGPGVGTEELNGYYHHRTGTHPFMLSSRTKPRRVPLVFRFVKGAIHGAIIIPVICHSIFTALVVCLDKYSFKSLGLPSTIVRFPITCDPTRL